MRVHAYASWGHYADHIAPIWRALPDEVKGQFVVTSPALVSRMQDVGVAAMLPRDAGKHVEAMRSREPIMVAAYSDLRKMRRRPVIFVEHGAGQTYVNADGSVHGGYSGGGNRDNVELFICPNRRVEAANLAAYPNAATAVCGSPRLDDLYAARQPDKLDGDPVFGVTFHWDCRIVPEAGTAFPYFADQIRDYVRMAQTCGVQIIGHGHPKAWLGYKDWWDSCGVPTESDWQKVAAQIDLLIVDNSSTIFEAAALDIPVVLLESPEWRRNVEHGLRFWGYADVGPTVRPGDDLGDAVADAFDKKWLERRREITKAVYTIQPSHNRMATWYAVDAVLDLLASKGEQ